MAFSSESLPKLEETLADYVARRRRRLSLSQAQLAKKAGIHVQTLGKIESGKTDRLATKTKSGLARALSTPEHYLEALVRGVEVTQVQPLKICPQCWTPGTEAEAGWLEPRAEYCFLCGHGLRDRCSECNKPIDSLRYRFCPHCGQPYKNEVASKNDG